MQVEDSDEGSSDGEGSSDDEGSRKRKSKGQAPGELQHDMVHAISAQYGICMKSNMHLTCWGNMACTHHLRIVQHNPFHTLMPAEAPVSSQA